MYQNWPKCRRLWNWKQNARSHWIQIRENGGSLHFNFISLPNSAVDGRTVFANIVYWSSSLENDAAYDVPIYWNSLWAANLLNVSTFLCTDRLSFSYFHLLTFVSSVILALQVCVLILGYVVHIIHITDAKCIMFGVSWHKSLKGSTTPASLYSKFCFSCLFVCINFRASKGALAQIVLQVFLRCKTLLHTEHSAFPVCLAEYISGLQVSSSYHGLVVRIFHKPAVDQL